MEKFAAGVACEADRASVQRGKEGERWKAVPAPQGADGRAGYRMAARTTARRAVIMSFSCDSAIPTTAAQTVARSYFYASPALGVNARFCRDEDGARPRRQLELDVLCAAPSPAVAAVDRDRVGGMRGSSSNPGGCQWPRPPGRAEIPVDRESHGIRPWKASAVPGFRSPGKPGRLVAGWTGATGPP